MMFWIIPAIGAVAGAMMNKKDPLKGALIGGGLGALGGAGLGAMGGAMGAGGAVGSQQAAMLAAQEAGLGSSAIGWGGATAGVPGMMNSVGGAGGLLNTAGNAAKTASTIKSLMPPEQQIASAPLFHSGGGGGMGDFYANLRNQRMAQSQAEMQRMANRYKRLNLIG